MTNNKTIIITGALGQDGKILSKILINKGYKIFGIVNTNKGVKIKSARYQKIKLYDYKKIKKFIKKINPSHIVHFGSKNPSFGDKDNFFKENYISTKNIIDSIIEVNNKIIFIFPNSSFIFRRKKTNVSEKDKYEVTNSYTKFRIKISDYMEVLKIKKNLKFCNLILFNHDSAYRKSSFLIPRLVSLVKKQDIASLKKIYKKNIIEDFSHAHDICFAIYLLIKKKICIDRLILSSGKKTKVNKIINYLLTKYFPFKKIKVLAKKNNKYIIGKNNLAKKILNWKIKKNIFLAVDEIAKN